MLYLTFFLLDQKEPKNQEQPDRSARLFRPFRTWVHTFLIMKYLNSHPDIVSDPSCPIIIFPVGCQNEFGMTKKHL